MRAGAADTSMQRIGWWEDPVGLGKRDRPPSLIAVTVVSPSLIFMVWS